MYGKNALFFLTVDPLTFISYLSRSSGKADGNETGKYILILLNIWYSGIMHTNPIGPTMWLNYTAVQYHLKMLVSITRAWNYKVQLR